MASIAAAGDARPIGRKGALRIAAAAGIIGPALFGLLVVCLTVAQFDFMRGLGWQPLGVSDVFWPSGLAVGPYGWLQVVNFVQCGALLVAFALGLHEGIAAGPGGRAGPALLIIAGIAMLCSGFKADPPYLSAAPATFGSWWIHTIAFFVLFGTLMPGMFVIARRLRLDARWRGYARYSAISGALTAALFFVPGQVAGYALLAVVLTWIAVLALRLWKIAASQAEG